MTPTPEEEKQTAIENLQAANLAQAFRLENLEKAVAIVEGDRKVSEGVEVSSISGHMLRAWKEFIRLSHEGIQVANDRQKAFELEKKIMQGLVLPTGLEVRHKKRVARIVGVTDVDIPTFGIFKYPLYTIEYQLADGSYPDRETRMLDTETCAQVYARDLENYGLQHPGVNDEEKIQG